MQVSKDPPAEMQKNTYLYQWELKVRKYFRYFETYKKAAREWVQRVQKNPFTRTQEFLRFLNKLKAPEILEMRQQLGDISKAEVSAYNKTFAKERSCYYRKSRSEPARVIAYRRNIVWVACASVIGTWYTMIRVRKGFLWWAATWVPFVFYLIYNRARQPVEEVSNCYRYILAKRTASAQMSEHDKEIAVLLKDNPKLKELQSYLKTSKLTLYELEHKMLQDIVKGQF